MVRKSSLKKLVAGAGAALCLAVSGAAQAQQAPKSVALEVVVVQKADVQQKPAAPIVEAPASAPVVAFDQPEQDGRGLGVGVGFYFIKPAWQSNASFTRTVTTVGPAPAFNTTTNSQSNDFRHDYEFAPRVVIDYVSPCGLGARISWWSFDGTATDRVVALPDPVAGPFTTITANGLGGFGFGGAPPAGQTDVFALRSALELTVMDFDITQEVVRNDQWLLTFGAGIRYAYISQTYEASRIRTGLAAPAINSQIQQSRNRFNGAGPDILLEGKRAIGGGGLALYANARAGALFGDGRNSSRNVVTNNFGGVGAVTNTFTNNSITDRNNHVIPFLDAEFGVEWQGSARGAFMPFLRLGVVGQSFWGVDSGFINGSPTDLGFFGGSLMAGVNF